MMVVALLCLQTVQARVKPLQVHEQGAFPSPKGGWTAIVQRGEAEARSLSIVKDKKVVFQDKDVNGFAWLPGRRPTLIFATSSVYGEAKLAMWTPKGVHALTKAILQDETAFWLTGIEEDGPAFRIRYRLGPAGTPADKLTEHAIGCSTP